MSHSLLSHYRKTANAGATNIGTHGINGPIKVGRAHRNGLLRHPYCRAAGFTSSKTHGEVGGWLRPPTPDQRSFLRQAIKQPTTDMPRRQTLASPSSEPGDSAKGGPPGGIKWSPPYTV